MVSLTRMKLSRPKAASAMSCGILLNHDSPPIWLPCANRASRLRGRTDLMSTVVVMRSSEASDRRQGDRREKAEVEGQLSSLGYAFVRLA